ncbi:hypothetical protein SPBR_03151 [Sporothrix brasiliensis 5110]|uniref:Uncharacterized protein n=1 Tax=Sporothrix brasiliensis 5110 TaxID=1398154 RepID=A0A0C2J035_9PEZI|nr:uncharacterized protein SPBR_03151 [Sporothrix brasiliensis 5110]KIH92360.1 hypothetical protein SPBR_03151 [Sporothrix brasiliensis 5110]
MGSSRQPHPWAPPPSVFRQAQLAPRGQDERRDDKVTGPKWKNLVDERQQPMPGRERKPPPGTLHLGDSWMMPRLQIIAIAEAAGTPLEEQ